jgi:hypothetical protein
VWHLLAAEPLTGRQFLTLVYEAAGLAPKADVASRPMIRLVGVFDPLVRELNETLYQFERPFVSDASTFQGAFGPFEPTPHQEVCGTPWTGSGTGTPAEPPGPDRGIVAGDGA